jgi:hypothetical protein
MTKKTREHLVGLIVLTVVSGIIVAYVGLAQPAQALVLDWVLLIALAVGVVCTMMARRSNSEPSG